MAEKEYRVKHMCQYDGCLKTFSRPNRLEQHMRVHTGEKPYKCDFSGCKHSYARSAHLKRHKETAHSRNTPPVKPVMCDEDGCNKSFMNPQNLKRHVSEVHVKKDYGCPEENCDQYFRKRYQLKAHMYEHKGVLPYQCHFENCKQRFRSKSHLDRHLKVHDGYKCDVDGCGLVFSTWTLYRKHKATEHAPGTRQAKCHICGTVFSRRSWLNQHLKTHTPQRTQLMCPREGCDRTYAEQRNLNQHIRYFHDNTGFTCDTCKRVLSTKQKLQQHIQTHSPSYKGKQYPLRKGVPKKGSGMAKKLTHALLTRSGEKSKEVTDNSNNEAVQARRVRKVTVHPIEFNFSEDEDMETFNKKDLHLDGSLSKRFGDSSDKVHVEDSFREQGQCLSASEGPNPTMHRDELNQNSSVQILDLRGNSNLLNCGDGKAEKVESVSVEILAVITDSDTVRKEEVSGSIADSDVDIEMTVEVGEEKGRCTDACEECSRSAHDNSSAHAGSCVETIEDTEMEGETSDDKNVCADVCEDSYEKSKENACESPSTTYNKVRIVNKVTVEALDFSSDTAIEDVHTEQQDVRTDRVSDYQEEVILIELDSSSGDADETEIPYDESCSSASCGTETIEIIRHETNIDTKALQSVTESDNKDLFVEANTSAETADITMSARGVDHTHEINKDTHVLHPESDTHSDTILSQKTNTSAKTTVIVTQAQATENRCEMKSDKKVHLQEEEVDNKNLCGSVYAAPHTEVNSRTKPAENTTVVQITENTCEMDAETDALLAEKEMSRGAKSAWDSVKNKEAMTERTKRTLIETATTETHCEMGTLESPSDATTSDNVNDKSNISEENTATDTITDGNIGFSTKETGEVVDVNITLSGNKELQVSSNTDILTPPENLVNGGNTGVENGAQIANVRPGEFSHVNQDSVNKEMAMGEIDNLEKDKRMDIIEGNECRDETVKMGKPTEIQSVVNDSDCKETTSCVREDTVTFSVHEDSNFVKKDCGDITVNVLNGNELNNHDFDEQSGTITAAGCNKGTRNDPPDKPRKENGNGKGIETGTENGHSVDVRLPSEHTQNKACSRKDKDTEVVHPNHEDVNKIQDHKRSDLCSVKVTTQRNWKSNACDNTKNDTRIPACFTKTSEIKPQTHKVSDSTGSVKSQQQARITQGELTTETKDFAGTFKNNNSASCNDNTCDKLKKRVAESIPNQRRKKVCVSNRTEKALGGASGFTGVTAGNVRDKLSAIIFNATK